MLHSHPTVFDSSHELAIKIQTPGGVVWEGGADSVSSENSAGPFDILPDHAQIITLIERKPILVTIGKESRTFAFEKAIISVNDNNVSIFADIALNSESADSKQPI